MPASKPRKINPVALATATAAVGISSAKALEIWGYADQFKSWDLKAFMASPPAQISVTRAERVAVLVSQQPGDKR